MYYLYDEYRPGLITLADDDKATIAYISTDLSTKQVSEWWFEGIVKACECFVQRENGRRKKW